MLLVGKYIVNHFFLLANEPISSSSPSHLLERFSQIYNHRTFNPHGNERKNWPQQQQQQQQNAAADSDLFFLRPLRVLRLL